jgi:hypothetical protein
MGRHRCLLIAPLVLGLVASAPASASDTVVAELQRPSTIRSYAGIQVFSAFEDGAYRLAILRADTVELVPVEPAQAPFDADIGTDGKGRPQLVYTRCEAAGRRCDLYAFSLAGGGVERPVRSANTTDGDEFAPTLWNGRLAFARKVEGRDLPAVYTRQLSSPRSRPSVRLPGIRRRTSTRGVLELELHGRRLAQIVFFAGQTEVRLVGLADRGVRRLARTGVGEGGQYFAGIGFAAGHLAWVSSWIGGGGAVRPGIYRYRLTTGALARAAFPPAAAGPIVGLALFDADGAYAIDARPQEDGCGETLGEVPVPRPCQLIRSEPLPFRPLGSAR